MQVVGIDHIVITVADLEKTMSFYAKVLGMKPITFGESRRALLCGNQKINIHQAEAEILPAANFPTVGSMDLCFLIEGLIENYVDHLFHCGIEIIAGPVQRTGAKGPMLSVYFNDPDGNLLEVASYEN